MCPQSACTIGHFMGVYFHAPTTVHTHLTKLMDVSTAVIAAYLIISASGSKKPSFGSQALKLGWTSLCCSKLLQFACCWTLHSWCLFCNHWKCSDNLMAIIEFDPPLSPCTMLIGVMLSTSLLHLSTLFGAGRGGIWAEEESSYIHARYCSKTLSNIGASSEEKKVQNEHPN